MKIFLTGATGYIGQKLALSALSKGHHVHALVRRTADAVLPAHRNLHCFSGDITDYTSVEKAMEGCEAVLHAAGLTRLWHRDRSAFYSVNVGGTRNVLDAASTLNVRRLVYTSTGAVLGPSPAHPLSEDDLRIAPFENDYEISKHCAEELVKEYSRRGLFAVTVALPRVYGPGLLTSGNPVTRLIGNTMRRGIAFVPDARHVVGNYAFIGDVVEGHFLALEKGLGGEKYILGGENHSYQELFALICRAAPGKIRIVRVHRLVLKAAGAFWYGVNMTAGKHTHFTPKIVNRLYQNRALSCEKAVTQLGYQITPLEKGIQVTVQFLKDASC